MRALAWRLIAWALVRPRVIAWLRARGLRNPYSHIRSADRADIYMYRFWIFNPYGKDPAGEITPPRWVWLPSVRLHCIMRPDGDRHLHDHPWNARTIVLDGEYAEEQALSLEDARRRPRVALFFGGDDIREAFTRRAGYTGRLLFGQYHRITRVSSGGVWTLFFTWGKRGSWGFKVNGAKVPWREYLGIK
jgi:hypothetical protein